MSPPLPVLTPPDRLIDGVPYPDAIDILSSDVLDDWIVRVDDALIEARNGVTAIAWPFVLAGFLGFLAIFADIADHVHNIGAALADNPFKAVAGLILLFATIGAFKVADQTTKKRRNLVTIRGSYLRRRRDLAHKDS